jgi:hypothetical protein
LESLLFLSSSFAFWMSAERASEEHIGDLLSFLSLTARADVRGTAMEYLRGITASDAKHSVFFDHRSATDQESIGSLL